ncbi:MAG TPA: hypothetical protein VF226_06615 [Hyphomicrobiaceae bacterium]
MSTEKARHPFPRPPSPQPEHQATGRDYPAEWARRFELYLDKAPRRAVFYGVLFAAFVIAVVISTIVKFGA